MREQATILQLRSKIHDLHQEVQNKTVLAQNLRDELILKGKTIKELQDEMTKLQTKVKELEDSAVRSEERNITRIKELENIATQSEEKAKKAIQDLKDLKSSMESTIEIEAAKQMNTCLNQIEAKYPDLDFSCVYDPDASSDADISLEDANNSGAA